MKGPEPQRTCLACRRKRPKGELLRIVRSPEGEVRVDSGNGAEGRGTYVCRDERACGRAVAREGVLARALHASLTPGDLARLAREIEREKTEA